MVRRYQNTGYGIHVPLNQANKFLDVGNEIAEIDQLVVRRRTCLVKMHFQISGESFRSADT